MKYKDERTATSTRSSDLYKVLAERFDQIPVLLPKETPGRVVKVVEEEDDKKKKKKNGTHASLSYQLRPRYAHYEAHC